MSLFLLPLGDGSGSVSGVSRVDLTYAGRSGESGSNIAWSDESAGLQGVVSAAAQASANRIGNAAGAYLWWELGTLEHFPTIILSGRYGACGGVGSGDCVVGLGLVYYTTTPDITVSSPTTTRGVYYHGGFFPVSGTKDLQLSLAHQSTIFGSTARAIDEFSLHFPHPENSTGQAVLEEGVYRQQPGTDSVVAGGVSFSRNAFTATTRVAAFLKLMRRNGVAVSDDYTFQARIEALILDNGGITPAI